MITYVLVGGMRGTTWVQIIKAVLLIGGRRDHDDLGAGEVRLQPVLAAGSRPSTAAARPRPTSSTRATSTASRRPAGSTSSRWRWPGARHRGPAARPDALLHRADGAGSASLRGVGDLADRHLLPVHPGARIRRRRARRTRNDPRRPGAANSAAPLLAFELGGTILLGVIAAVAFATILAVVAGLTITAATSFAHDIYANVMNREAEPTSEAGPGRAHHRGCHRHRVDRRRHPCRWARTSRSWWRWPSRWRHRPTCRRFSTRCSGSGSTPAARCGACTAVSSPAWC